MSILQIYSDGASNVHDEKLPGGWASVYVIDNMLIDQMYGGEAPTTNQRMEIMGALNGLRDYKSRPKIQEFLPTITELQVVTDSAYVYRCMVEMWYVKWEFNNWEGIEGPVKNKDLWQELIQTVREIKKIGLDLTWRKIRGHKGDMYNEVADKLAVRGKLENS